MVHFTPKEEREDVDESNKMISELVSGMTGMVNTKAYYIAVVSTAVILLIVILMFRG